MDTSPQAPKPRRPFKPRVRGYTVRPRPQLQPPQLPSENPTHTTALPPLPTPHPNLREEFIARVTKLAAELNRQPTQKELRDVARIRDDDCRRVFGDYSALLRAAGFRGALKSKRLHPKHADEMLDDYGRAIGRLGRFPTISEYLDRGLFTYASFHKQFKSWHTVRAEFLKRSGGKTNWQSTLRKLIQDQPPTTYTPKDDRPVCGTLLNYRAMLHEPTNEQGVVLLFGMMAEELGFIIENVRTNYPDCEGKRRVGENAWQRVRIEFEYLSSRFNHPEDGCDLIICWRHDRPTLKTEVIALEQVLQDRRTIVSKPLPWGNH